MKDPLKKKRRDVQRTLRLCPVCGRRPKIRYLGRQPFGFWSLPVYQVYCRSLFERRAHMAEDVTGVTEITILLDINDRWNEHCNRYIAELRRKPQ